MKTIGRYWLAGSALSIQLLISGCGGGGLVGLFGVDEAEFAGLLGGLSSSSSGDSEQNNGSSHSTTTFEPTITESADSGITEHSLLGDTTDENFEEIRSTHPVASVHHPEPASLALFGGGLASVGLLRRKKARKK